MQIDLLIFDCDGVLINSEPIASRTLAKALQDAGAAITAEEVLVRFTGNSPGAIRRICTEELGIENLDAVFAAWHLDIYPEFARSLEPMPGMERLVRSLPHRKCVASNSSTDRLSKSLGLLDLWHAFAPAVFSSDRVARPKPAPDLFHFCAETFAVDPKNCVVIDDSSHGITGAKAAGMVAIGFVDPADPRPDRARVLAEAGAALVARGAEELEKALASLEARQAARA
ncbi:HAD-IA family hydrolase [Neorhizobium sp. CSC1952]|uniref:HAD family hydrolase n=1 Tax=Neorhizobium sp. CSC1952 TaxID=2978974 RepID=UPI0025A5281D|nr:HAD-IA family hydrolase [Rhizobium sp. CSC1952]WJR68683.1 HAD-IA family hydrolase [Rhizobium sp. CSC1952]